MRKQCGIAEKRCSMATRLSKSRKVSAITNYSVGVGVGVGVHDSLCIGRAFPGAWESTRAAWATAAIRPRQTAPAMSGANSLRLVSFSFMFSFVPRFVRLVIPDYTIRVLGADAVRFKQNIKCDVESRWNFDWRASGKASQNQGLATLL